MAKRKPIKKASEDLSQREIEVLKLYVLLKAIQIATRLCIDYETVKPI